MKESKQHFFDDPKNVQLILRVFYVCCGVLFLLDFVINRKTYHSWESLWGFYPIYGFIGCVVLVVIAKWMRIFLLRDEEYYEPLDEESGKEEDGK